MTSQSESTRVKELEEWKDAVIDALVVDGIFTADHETDPRKAINDLLAWQIKLALDPAVSKEAHELVERTEAAESRLTALEKTIIQNFSDYDFTPTMPQALEMLVAERRDYKDREIKFMARVKELEGKLVAAEQRVQELELAFDNQTRNVTNAVRQLSQAESTLARLREILAQQLEPLLKELWNAHRDVQAHEFNDCGDGKDCAWCEETKAIMSTLLTSEKHKEEKE